jgi:hypothetical protein
MSETIETPNISKQGMYPQAAYIPHDCNAWNRQHYHLNPNYRASTCGLCGAITGFQWRGWWRRIRSLFTPEPILTKIVDPDP